MKNVRVISGDKVNLERFKTEHLPNILKWKNDEELSKLIMSRFRVNSMKDIEKWYHKNCFDDNQEVFGVFEKSRISPIGMIRLMFIDWVSKNCELGLFIGEREFRGKGLGTEVMSLIFRHAFMNLNLNRVFLKVSEPNTGSIHLYEKSGMKIEGRLRDHFLLNGKFVDVLIMGILVSEFDG